MADENDQNDQNDQNDELDGLTDADAEQLLAKAVAEDNQSDGDASDSSDSDLGDRGKRALSAIRAERDAARKELADARRALSSHTKQAKTVEQQLEDLRGKLAERDKRDEERNGRLAMAKLDAQLAKGGIERADVDGLLKRIKGADLLADGEPDDQAIGELAESLMKVAGRATPDPDQGKKGGKAPLDMNQLIRRAAGIS